MEGCGDSSAAPLPSPREELAGGTEGDGQVFLGTQTPNDSPFQKQAIEDSQPQCSVS